MSFNFTNKVVILVDEGINSGLRMIAGLRQVWQFSPHKLIVATPVINKQVLTKIALETDGLIFLQAPDNFINIQQWYL